MSTFHFDPDARRIRITDDQILDSLRAFAATVNNRPFRMREYDAWPQRIVAANTIPSRLGRWRDVLKRIGIEGGRSKKYTPEELIDNLEAVWRKLGRPPGNDTLASRGHIGFAPYIRVFGSVRNACELLAQYHAGKLTREKLLRVNPDNRKPNRVLRRPLPPHRRWQVLQRDHYRCTLCGQNPAADPTVQLHVDHIHPVSAGGDNSLTNLRTLCRECNEGKSDQLPNAAAEQSRAAQAAEVFLPSEPPP